MKYIVGLIAAAGMISATSANSAAFPPEFCRIVADDSAYVMSVRQRGQPMESVGAAINWQKYDQSVFRDLLIGIMADAWSRPIERSSQEKQAAVSEFARSNFDACRRAK